MVTNIIKLKFLLAFAISALVFLQVFTGCNSSKSTPLINPPPVQTTHDLVTVGPITAFSSVIVNGIEFNSDSALVTINGQQAEVADLRIGMIASIHANVIDSNGAATATEINYVDDVEGIITNINVATNRLTVLGRTVLIDELTAFEGATFDTLEVGNIVQVSGQWRHQEQLQATYIEHKAHQYMMGMRMHVKGEIEDLDPVQQRFRIGSQDCDYSGAAMELNGATLANGMYVEVSSTVALQENTLLLDQVQARSHDRDRDQDQDRLCDSDCEFEVLGFITEFVSAIEFDVEGLSVTTTSTTEYVNGTVDTLAMDVKVKIDGFLNDDGILVAERIVFSLPSLVEIDADIDSLDIANNSLSVLGIAVDTNLSTLFRDHSDAALREFSLDDLVVGDRVEVKAYIDNDTVVASRLERDDAKDSVILKALIESINQPSVVMLGVTVDTHQDTLYQDATKQIIDEETFFTLVAEGSLVRAEGIYDGSSILADKLFLRDCENSCP